MSIAKTFGTLSLTAMGLLNAADATAQETKTSPKQEPAKVVKFIADKNEATLVSKSTNAELTGRARVEAATAKPIEFTQEELKDRAKLIEKFSHLLPTEKAERESFMERSSKISNPYLETLFVGTTDLLKVGIIDDSKKKVLFRSEDLLHSANLVGRAANVFFAKKATEEQTKQFVNKQIGLLNLVTFSDQVDSSKLVKN